MKIAFFDVSPQEEGHIRKAGMECALFRESLKKGRAADWEIISTTTASHISRAVLETLPKLRMVATRSTGFDHIDLEECRKKNIIVCNTPFYGETAVAEHTIALMLAISRKICEANARAKNNGFSAEGLCGFDLNKKTLGIIGAGSIGKAVIRIASAFGMNILAYDLKKDKKLGKKIRYAALGELLKKSDIISLHAPLNAETRHIINRESISKMRSKAVIINTARGELIDTNALLDALNKGKISAAGLDVLENEAEIKKKGIPKDIGKQIKKGKIIMTPHNAFNSTEAIKRRTNTTASNIKSFMKNKPINVIK